MAHPSTSPSPPPTRGFRCGILTLGRGALEPIDAEVYLLTDRQPALLPKAPTALKVEADGPASQSLMTDLKSDKGMGWMPDHAWLTAFHIDGQARDLHFDLAIDASGQNSPSTIATGLVSYRSTTTFGSTHRDAHWGPGLLALVGMAVTTVAWLLWARRRAAEETAWARRS